MEERVQEPLFEEKPPSGKMMKVLMSEIDLNFPLPPVDDGFVDSIRKHGVLEPILLRSIEFPDTDEMKYQIVAGRRRYAAAMSLEHSHIPAVVFDVGENVGSVQTLVENAQRERNPVAEYKAARSLVNQGYSLSEIGMAVGKTTTEIEQLLKLSVLPEAMIDGMENGSITLPTAHRLANMPAAYIDKASGLYHEKGKLTGADLKAMRDTGKKNVTMTLPDSAFEPVEPEPRGEDVMDDSPNPTLQDLLAVCPKWLLERMLGTVKKAKHAGLEKRIQDYLSKLAEG